MIWFAILALPALFLALAAGCACVAGSRADHPRYHEADYLGSHPAQTDRYPGLPSLELTS